MPDVYRRFALVVGESHWRQRVRAVRATIKSNRFLSDLLHTENSIAFSLARTGDLIARYGRLPDEEVETRALFPAISFAGQVLSLMDLATPVEAERLRRRVQDTLKNPDSMRGYRLELGVATHFARRGYKVEWPEILDKGTFDLLVTDLTGASLEIECKSVSADKGRRVHRHEALTFHNLLWPELAAIRKNLRSGLAVVLTVPGRLPSRHGDRLALARRVRQQINLGQSARFEDGSDIRISEFDVKCLGDLSKDRAPVSVRPVIDKVTATQNREGLVLGTAAGGALVFVVQSAENDDLLDTTFETLSQAAKRQLTGMRPGILVAGFDSLEAEQLLSIAQQDRDPQKVPTALALKVSKFLSAQHRDHLVGVAFLSRGAIFPEIDGSSDSGVAYYFTNSKSSRWNESFSGLFSARSLRSNDVLANHSA